MEPSQPHASPNKRDAGRSTTLHLSADRSAGIPLRARHGSILAISKGCVNKLRTRLLGVQMQLKLAVASENPSPRVDSARATYGSFAAQNMAPPCRKINVLTSHGPVTFDYVISTPRETSAKTINRALPTVLLLHTVFFGKEMFHYQFADPSLRRFNLVTVDLLCHGDTAGLVPEDYDQKMAAADIVAFIDALHLPPCTVTGLAMGAIFAMQLAVSFPERVTGLFLVTALCTPELPEVAAGRQQIVDLWVASFDRNTNGDLVDRESMDDAIFGALQLGFNSHETSFVQAMTKLATAQCMMAQAQQPAGCIRATCTIFVERTGYTDTELEPLARSKIPVALVHGSKDVAYPPEYYAQFAQQLARSGVNVRLHEIDGAPHFASTTHHRHINPLLVQLVLDVWDDDEQPPTHAVGITSPFYDLLRAAGWRESSNSDESDGEL